MAGPRHTRGSPSPPAALQGTIPKISDLPAPWGPKPLEPASPEELTRAGYLPPRFPPGFSPLRDVAAA